MRSVRTRNRADRPPSRSTANKSLDMPQGTVPSHQPTTIEQSASASERRQSGWPVNTVSTATRMVLLVCTNTSSRAEGEAFFGKRRDYGKLRQG